jgi:sugar lactone lactonase YvrE
MLTKNGAVAPAVAVCFLLLTTLPLSVPSSAADGRVPFEIADARSSQMPPMGRCGPTGPSGKASPSTRSSLCAANSESPVESAGDTGEAEDVSGGSATLSDVIETVAGNGTAGYGGDGGLATLARLANPSGAAIGPDGSLYVADYTNHRIRRVGPDGIITTVAGSGTAGFSGDGGSALQARFNGPYGVALGPDGSLYIADMWNHRIRRVQPDGIITTVAGTTTPGFSGDGGRATLARLYGPSGVAFGPDGSLYIADTYNSRIRQVGADGIITTFAGGGTASGDGELATNATLGYPSGVAVGPDGSLYFADAGTSYVRRVGLDGIIMTVAGTGTAGYSGDGGEAIMAQLNGPSGVAFGPYGSLYIADQSNHRIRRVGSGGIITTVAGTGTPDFNGDGGPATEAQLNSPAGVVLGPDGSLYLAEWSNHRIRRVGYPSN